MKTDLILTWNEVALEANRASHTNGNGEQTGPPLSARALAIVHLAIYDAYAAITKDPKLPNYLKPSTPVPPPSALKAAVGGAAFEALANLFPSQLDYFKSQLDLHGEPGNLAGHEFGQAVARAILNDRKDDPSAGRGKYQPKKERGKHRVDPDNPMQGYHATTYGSQAKPFAVADKHELDPPPKLDHDEYREALRQVRAKGIKPELMSTLPEDFFKKRRTAEETLIGLFWGYDGAAGLGTPPRFYNQIVRLVAEQRGNSEADNARLFALINVAMADAGILAWREKYKHDLWRPVLALREQDDAFGPREDETTAASASAISKDADPGWLPLGAPSSNAATLCVQTAQAAFPFASAQIGRVKNFTPNFPAYPSGHATFGAAALHMTRLFYDKGLIGNRKPDDLLKVNGKDLAFVSEEFDGSTQDNNGAVRPRYRRTFPGGLWQMLIDNGLSRIFLGVHWSFDAFALKGDAPDLSRNIGGVPLGLNIAEDIFKRGNGAPQKPKS